jgi:replication factor A1
MATASKGGDKPALRKPVFTKVDKLAPGNDRHTLTVKVVSSAPVVARGRVGGGPAAVGGSRPTRIAECLVGDETGAILFTARNEQGDGRFCSPFLTFFFRVFSMYVRVVISSVQDIMHRDF